MTSVLKRFLNLEVIITFWVNTVRMCDLVGYFELKWFVVTIS